MPDRYARSAALLKAAGSLMPGGVPRGTRPLGPPGEAPLYFERGSGGRIVDADGQAYLDFVLAYGAVVLGYAHPEVDDAAIGEVRRGLLLSMNHPRHLDFLRAVIDRFPSAERGWFLKTGSEATTAAVRIARRHTGRTTVVRCGYHGWHDWCFPDDGSVPAGLREQVLPLPKPTPEALDTLLARHRGRVGAVIVAPERVLPLARAPLQAMIDLAHAHGAVFVLDEIKTGLRAPGGSVQQALDLRPDITTLSKALGNGWPVAAVIGRADVMQAGEALHLSATYHGETAAMAAALATLRVLDRDRVPGHLDRLGRRLIDGLSDIVRRHRVPARAYAEPIPAMPFLAFDGPDPARRDARRAAFHRALFDRGVLLHPTHLWYVCQAHTEADIDQALAAADDAMGIAMRAVPT